MFLSLCYYLINIVYFKNFKFEFVLQNYVGEGCFTVFTDCFKADRK